MMIEVRRKIVVLCDLLNKDDKITFKFGDD